MPRSARRRLEKVIYFAAARSRASKTTRTFWRGVGLVYGISELATAEVYCGVWKVEEAEAKEAEVK